MVKKGVVNYIKSQLQKGYNISTIRDVMLKYGYTNKDVNEAINEVYHPTIRHEIHLGPTTVFVIIFAIVAVIGATLFVFYPPKGPTKLLDLNLEPVTTTVAPGEKIDYVKELSNLGSSKRYDVVIVQEIIEPKTFKPVTEKTETMAIETFGAKRSQFLVPAETKPGDYILRVIVEYDNKKAVATLPIKVTASSKKEELKEKILTECDDSNPCTSDVIENGACTNKPIVPCCGNNACEENEQQNCPADCKKSEPIAEVPSPEIVEEIRELAKLNPSKALQQCNQIDVPDLKDSCISKIGEVQRNKEYCTQIKNTRTKDLCYLNIAKTANNNAICESISTDGIKDQCYMTFVLDNKDYSVCNKLINKQLRQSCDYLRQLHELNKENQNQEQQSQLP